MIEIEYALGYSGRTRGVLLVRERFSDLSREEQNVVSEIGSELNPDTATLFYLLEDNILYTSGMAAATRYDKKKNPKAFRRMRARIVSFTTYRKMTEHPDGKIGGKSAWYGSTFKGVMGDRSYFRAELNLELLAVLSRFQQIKAGIILPTRPGPGFAPLPPIAAMSQSSTSSGPPWFKLIVLAALTIMTITSWLYVTDRLPFEASENYGRVAMLACYEDGIGVTLRDMVTESMSRADRISALPAHRIEKEIGPYSVCKPPKEKVLRRLFDDLQVSYLLWGETEELGRKYRWKGRMTRHDGENRSIDVSASSHRDLAAAIVRKCLEMLGSEETPLSPVGLYSANMNAAFLYSEANVHYRNGNIVAAGANYQRAGTVFDPSFHMARIKWAQCLHIQGRLLEARGILEALLEMDKPLNSVITIQAARTLAGIYFDNYELEKLDALLSEMEGLNPNAEDRLFFFQVKARALFLLDQWDEAKRLAKQARELTHHTITPQTRIDVLTTFAWLAARGSDPEPSLDVLEQALALARAHDLHSREIDVLGDMARIILETGNPERIASFFPRLEEASPLAGSSGNMKDRLTLDYWLGRCDTALNRNEEAAYHYHRVAMDSGKSGLAELEIKAKIALVRHRIRENNLLEARRLLESLEPDIRQKPLKHQLLYFDSVYSLNLERGQYLLALDAITSFQEIAQVLDNKDRIALALNKKGWALYRMSRLNVAEKAWTMALSMESRHQETILKNLIMLMEDLGKLGDAKNYITRLKSLDRPGEYLTNEKAE